MSGVRKLRQVAKLVIVDQDGRYLLMYRNQHPVFGDDPDLLGGTLEDGEVPLEAMVREVEEEAGFIIDKDKVEKVFSGTEYSIHGTLQTLFLARLDYRPEIIISWEHLSYEWLDRDEFLQKAKAANDNYMHMVYEVLNSIELPITQ